MLLDLNNESMLAKLCCFLQSKQTKLHIHSFFLIFDSSAYGVLKSALSLAGFVLFLWVVSLTVYLLLIIAKETERAKVERFEW